MTEVTDGDFGKRSTAPARPEQDRDGGVNSSLRGFAEILALAGFDLSDVAERRRLADVLRFAADREAASRKKNDTRQKVMLAFIAAVISSSLGILFTKFFSPGAEWLLKWSGK